MKNSPRSQSIGAQMYIVVSIFKKRMSTAIARKTKEITLEQLGILEELAVQGSMNMTQLSNALNKENTNITRLVDKLEKKQFLQRVSDPNDRRANIIQITESGKQLFKNLVPILVSELKEATATVTKDEYNEMLRILKKIIAENS